MTELVPSNTTTQPLFGSAVYFGGWVSVNDDDYGAIQVVATADQIGTIVIQHATLASANFIIYSDEKPVDISTPTILVASVKAPFFRVKYENGTQNQTSFSLTTTLAKTFNGDVSVSVVLDPATSGVAVFGQKPDSSLQEFQLDASGNLKTTATLSVEGTLNVSDADTHTLLSDVSGAIYENTDRLLFDLDIIANHGDDASANALELIAVVEQQTTDLSNALTAVVNGLQDISGSVSISNFPATQDISGSVSVSNQITGFATESTLDAVATTAEDISLQLTVPQRSWVEVDFDTQSSQVVQGTGTWRVPLTGEQGWEYVNSTIGGATAYFYSNTELVAGGLESNITLGSLTSMFFVGNYRLATAVNPNRRFYLSVYTKPQGAGDFQPWYRSSKTWQLPNSAIVSKGADVFYYAGLDIDTIYKEYDHTAYELAVSNGFCADDEVIQFMSLAVDSECPANEFDGIVKHAGFSTASGTNRIVTFTRASREKIAEDNLKALTVQTGELLVKDLSAVALLAEIANGITVQVGQVEISGVVITEISGVPVVEISGNVVADVTFPTVQVVEVSGVPVVEISGNVVADVTFPTVQVVEVSGVPVVEISGASFTETKMNVFDASASSHLSVIEEILENGFVNVYDASCELVLEGIKTQTDKLAFYNEGTFESLRVRVENPSSGGGVVEISGVTLVDGKLPVFDASANEPLSKLSFYADMYGAFDLRTQVMNEIGVSVNNTPTVGLSGGTEVGLVSGTQVALAAGSQVQLVSSEVSLTAGTTVGLSAGTSVDVNNFPAKQSVFVENTAEGFDLNVNVTNASLDIGNFPAKQSVFVENTAEGFDLNVNVTNASVAITTATALDVNVQNTSLDAHVYGSSDGTTWHHIKTNPNGVVATNAIMETDANGALTSTAVSGTETYNALHTIIKGSASVVNPAGSQLAVKAQQYGSYGNVANNVASILPSGVTAGINVADWSYFVGAYEDYNGATTGTISLEYSFDNITYYTLFNTQIFPSGTGTPRRANINKQDIPAVNWIRLRNGTSSTLLSVTLTLLGGSVS